MPLAPPPDRVLYPSWDACLSAVQAHAAREGYAVNAKGQTKARDTGLYRRFGIRCDKSGKFKPTSEVRVRRSSTKKTDCPFAAAAIVEPEGCYFSVMVQHHNHPPALAAAYTQHRKLTPEQRQFVEDAMAHERTIRQIWDDFKVRYPYSLVTHKDMDNAVQRFRKKVKQGATGVQAMMYKLVEPPDGTGRRKRNRANATNTTQSQEGGGEANGEDEEQMDEDGEPQDEDEGEEGGEGEEEDDDDDDDDDDEEEEDDDMDGDNDSDAEIARQLTAGNPHGGVNYRPMAHPQSPRHTAHPHGQNAMSATGPVQQQGRLPLPGHPSMQAQQQPSTYNPAIGGIPGRAMAGHQHQHRPM
ncbi:hypothetical protein F4802DRAFT_336256 [Xylaria palmicola]|nr:hypothetical protein F4802DRAFT_336256 [Xylaria palmicola]